MNPQYTSKLQDWVKYDNQLLRTKEQTKEISEKKKVIEQEVVEYALQNNMRNITINISDGNIKFASVNSKAPLSKRTLLQLLENYSKEVKPIENLQHIVEYVFDNLETNTKTFIKREIKE